ncbi:class I SAM-dependent methyltransferase [Photobacterium sp. BZF1]|uniref:class I SAM-dependent methyltransferase n=1 Tax=Photobacterium sp. BZF1 TaxID=1904457 RepID=UPI001653E6C1|nr:class I SAM-dependent methyltransferase [Photobacterium sp. BZF1]MBC7005040.1 class I SAM-dependent methyltransferase [Photobacterium sp. BZF1]
MSSIYKKFETLLPEQSKILDAGCGSGRDSLYFTQNGHFVDAFDSSTELVKLASIHSSLNVINSTFLQYNNDSLYDGIWACASLLHVSKQNLPNTFNHLGNLLRNSGVFYCSFKYGIKEVERDGRTFTDLTEDKLAEVLANTDLSVNEVWQTRDLRPGRVNEKWLNAILVKA